MNRRSFVFLLCTAFLLAGLAVLILPDLNHTAYARQNASPTPVCRDPTGKQVPCTATPVKRPPRKTPTPTNVPYIPPRITDTPTLVPTETYTPTRVPLQLYSTVTEIAGIPDPDPFGDSNPFNPLSPENLPKIVGFGLLGLGLILSILLGRLIYRARRPGSPPTGDPDHKGWAEVEDLRKVEMFDKDHKGWSELGEFPKIEQNGLNEFPKIEQGGQAGKGWSELGEFPKIEQNGLNEFPKIDQNGLNEFHKIDQNGLDEFPKIDQNGLDDFPKIEGSGQ